MRFFEYNKNIVNLTHVSNFNCHKIIAEENEYTLTAELNYSHGFWKNEEMNLGASVIIGRFQSQDEGVQVARDIIAGKYDLPVPSFEIIAPIDVNTETSPTETETQPEQEQPEDPEAKEKAISASRELLKHEQTKIITAELGIEIKTIHNEAQRLWGDSDDWNTEKWQNYVQAIADFHQRKGILYDKLKPQPSSETETNGNLETKKGPF